MSDFDGALAAGQMVADTLFIQNWGDHMRRMGEQNGLTAQNVSLQAQLAYAIQSYDQLVERYNGLARAANAAVQEADDAAAALKKRLAAVELERDRAKAEAAYLRTAFDAGINLGSNR